MVRPIKNKSNINCKFLIDVSESDEEIYNTEDSIELTSEKNINPKKNSSENINLENNIEESSQEDNNDSDDDDENTMYLIHNENTDSDDPNISEFIKFCIEKGYFDNTFYDMNNTFSVVATKLPRTFEKLSNNGDNVKKRVFIQKFKKDFGFHGNINFIYNCFDENKKGFITWDEFVDFFLPFIQYITV